jgi:hypothetical protein
MKTEINQAVEFLAQFLRHTLPTQDLAQFKCVLRSKLAKRFLRHWNEEVPDVGSAYRAITIDGGIIDPVLLFVATHCGLNNSQLFYLFPSDMALWIDPGCVSYRIGEYGQVHVLHESDGYQEQSFQQYAKEMNTNQFLKLALISAA